MTSTATTHWVLTFVCEDKPGIVHAISGAIVAANGNITESHQYTSLDTGRFFMRLQIESAVPRETKFSLAIISSMLRWRFSSAVRTAAISGSDSLSGKLNEEDINGLLLA